MATAATPVPKTKKTSSKNDKSYYEAVGRRKTSSARVRVYHAKKAGATINDKSYKPGSFVINGVDIAVWATSAADRAIMQKPLSLLSDDVSFVTYIKVIGGGKKGQRDAIVHGLARALCEIPSGDVKSKMKEYGFLTRDSRTRERRKVGTGGKARRLKQSPKR